MKTRCLKVHPYYKYLYIFINFGGLLLRVCYRYFKVRTYLLLETLSKCPPDMALKWSGITLWNTKEILYVHNYWQRICTFMVTEIIQSASSRKLERSCWFIFQFSQQSATGWFRNKGMSSLIARVALFVNVMFIANERLINWNGEVHSYNPAERCVQVWPLTSEYCSHWSFYLHLVMPAQSIGIATRPAKTKLRLALWAPRDVILLRFYFFIPCTGVYDAANSVVPGASLTVTLDISISSLITSGSLQKQWSNDSFYL